MGWHAYMWYGKAEEYKYLHTQLYITLYMEIIA